MKFWGSRADKREIPTCLCFLFLFLLNSSFFTIDVFGQSFKDASLEILIKKHNYALANKKVTAILTRQLPSLDRQKRTYYYTQASDILFKTGDYNPAWEMSKQAVLEASGIQDSFLIYSAWLAHAAITHSQGKLGEAHKFLEPAYQYAVRKNQPTLLRACYVQFGGMAAQNNRNQEAMDWFQKAMQLSTFHRLVEYIHYDEMNVAFAYCMLNQLDSAHFYLERSIKNAEADKDSTIIAAIYSVRAFYYLVLNDRPSWKQSILSSLEISKKIKHKALISGAYSQLMENALNDNQFKEALDLGNQAQALMKETPLPLFEVYLDSLMYEANKGLGNTATALSFFEKFYKGKHSILTKEQADKLDAIKTSYDMKEKNLVIQNQQLEIDFSKKKSLFLILLNVLLGILLFGSWFYRRMKQNYQGDLYKKEKMTDFLLEQQESLALNKDSFQSNKTQVAIPMDVELSANQDDLEIISEDKKELYVSMIRAIEDQKLYLNPNLDVNLIVTTLGTNKFYLYQAISKNASENFRNIINRYRVAEAKRLIEIGVREKSLFNIESIHTEAGFNSPSSYYRIFRNMTGLTPKEYMQEYMKDYRNNIQG